MQKASGEIVKEIAERIKHLRKTRGDSQKFMADLCGLTQSVWSKKERGEIEFSAVELVWITAIYRVEPDYLLWGYTAFGYKSEVWKRVNP